MEFDVVVEIPRGQRNKYEIDHESGRIRLDRTLFTSMHYPADYGYIEHTLGEDGDPLDAMVLVEEPTFPGCLIACRAIAVYEMTDDKGPDAKILCVPAGDPRYDRFQDLSSLSVFESGAIKHFFEQYKALEPNKLVIGSGWADKAAAEAEIAAAFERERGHTERPVASP